MKVYISGKIGETNISEATRKKFEHAALVLRNRMHEPFNPCDEEWQEHLKKQCRFDVDPWFDFYTYVLLRDQMALATKDAICLLPDWKESPGAKAELAFARATGKTILQLTEYGEIITWKTD